jgi:PPE-repeat protein
MDFAFLPPEVNSARMYTGPGSGSMLAAAGTWDLLAAELSTTAESYETVLSGLNLQWQGPASEAMTAATAHYMAWLLTTAEQTKHTAMQARAAAAAYEQAYAMTVPPPAVTANRTQLQALIATNFFGQNTAAIAATEAQYAEYWAQDAAAMYGYATGSAAATTLTPFSFPDQHPDQTTNPAGLTAQDAAVAQANANAAASNSSAEVISAFDPSLEALYAAIDPSSLFDLNLDALDLIRVIGTAINSSSKTSLDVDMIIGAEKELRLLPKAAAAAAAEVAPVAPRLTAAPQLGGGAGLGNITATLANASRLGSMSVPTSWALPSNAAATALSKGGLPSLAATAAPAGSGPGMSGMPGMPGGTVSRPTGVIPRYGRRILTVMGRPPGAG